jgi:hypothetical protein
MAYDDDTIRMFHMAQTVELISMMSEYIDDLEEEIFELRFQINELVYEDEDSYTNPYDLTFGDDSYLYHPIFKAVCDFIVEFGL